MKEIFVILIVFSGIVAAQQQTNEPPYCFRFTWIGPKFNVNSTFFNGTCDDVTRGADVPCTRPLVVTDNSQVPNTTYMWDAFKESKTDIACPLYPGSVCVKYSYYYNYALENITYMCTKVNIANGGPVTSNCYSEFQNGREIQVCVCESTQGNIPCNNGRKNSYFRLGIIFMIFLICLLLNI